MQDNRSFDNYFGVLAYAAGTPYHSARGRRRRACVDGDHTCVDGLSCKMKRGTLVCSNRNRSNTHGVVRSFHDPRYCTGSSESTPNANPMDQATGHDTMGYYTDADLPFYHGLAESFAISDRYFAAVLGPTLAAARALVVGVLAQALSDAVSPDRTVNSQRRRAAVQADARRCLASSSRAPFTCLWCCEQLGLDPDRVRRALAARAAA